MYLSITTLVVIGLILLRSDKMYCKIHIDSCKYREYSYDSKAHKAGKDCETKQEIIQEGAAKILKARLSIVYAN